MRKIALITLITLGGFSASKAQDTPNEDRIYSFVSMGDPPMFPGGLAAFYKFLGENIKYPEAAKQEKIQGKVFASFVVEKNGAITNVKIDKGLGYGTDEEALRVLKLSPNWTAGTLNGKPVKVKYNLPIEFSYNQKSKNQEVAQDKTVYSFVSLDGNPQFPGGIEQFQKFLDDNIKHPAEAKKANIKGEVLVSFTIEKNGKLNDIKIDKSLGHGTDEEVIRVLKLSPNWLPGTQGGTPVRTKYSLPISFVTNKK